MSVNEPADSVGRLRSTALTAVLAGAVGSVGFCLHAGRNSPQRLLIALIAAWVLAPFMGLLLTHLFSKRWSVLTRKTLYVVMLAVAVGSLAVYWNDMVRPRTAQPAAMFVLVPAVSWLVMAIVLPIAAFVSRRGR